MAIRVPAPGSRALRIGRCSEAGRIYLITAATNGRQPLFAGYDHALALSRLLAAGETWRAADLLTWLVMPDHIHVLILLEGATSLSAVLERALGRTAFAFNRCVGRRGKLWQGGFHDHALRTHDCVRAAARYLVANPLRAGLVRDIGEYPFWGSVWAGPEEMIP